MTRTRAKLLTVMCVAAAADGALSLHATLTRPVHPTVLSGAATGRTTPTVASLGEVLGWGTTFLLLLLIVMVIVDGVWVGRQAAAVTPQPPR